MAHIKLNHKSLFYSEVKCNFEKCTQIFNNIYCLKRHMLSKHISNYSQNICKKTEQGTNALQYSLNDANNVFHEKCNNIIEIISSTSNENNDINITDFKKKVDESATHLVMKLYADSTLNRNIIHDIIRNISLFYNSICLEFLKTKYKNIHDFYDVLQIIQNAFKNFKTEYLTFQYFQKIECLILPSDKIIHSFVTFGQIAKNKKRVIRYRNITVVPIKIVLKKFLEIPNVFSTITTYIEQCKKGNTIITSIIQSTFWQSIEKFAGDKVILPLVIFFDDIEINNPLGSHKSINKLGAVYCSIPCLPDEYSSRLENIFLLQLHNYVDHKHLGNKIIFNHLIDMIIDLEKNGIQIIVNGEQKTVFFTLTCIAGDNLGLNTILGFSKSFNSSHCCRICLVSKKDIQKQVREDINIIRTIQNYTTHCEENMFGIQENCVFNAIPSFHVTENLSVDPMHDLLEGICRYDIGKILNNLINKNRLFTLQVFHERIRFFNKTSFGENVIPPITLDSIQKELIILSASEMKNLVVNLSLFIGDLVPINNQVWELYLLLRQIVCIVFLHSLHMETIDLLEELICEYLSLYMKLFPNSLKFKHHNLLHYPRIMRKYGPLKFMTCLRFEGKHKEIKENSKICKSRLNPSFTIAVRHQLQLCYRFFCNEGFANRVSFGRVISKLHLIDSYIYFKNLLPSDGFKDYDSVNWVLINGTKYAINSVVCINVNDINPVFGKIKHIIISPTQNLFFVYTKMITLCYCRHLSAFEVEATQDMGFVSQENLSDCSVYCMHLMPDEKSYIPTHF